MLRHLFRPITLSLSLDGIAMRMPGQPARILNTSVQKFSTSQHLLDELSEAIQKSDVSIRGKRIRFILSDHFVRYSVLPWQSEIVSREDWFAIARHDFRKRYGAIADDWRVSVSFGGFGSNVVAAAIDETLYEGLSAFVQASGSKLVSIQPLLSAVLEQLKSNNMHEWLMLVEPERVLLCEVAGNQWHRFSVISPPHGAEFEQGVLLAQRSLQGIEHDQYPPGIYHCSAPGLAVDNLNKWSNGTVAFKPLPINVPIHESSAALWMAGF